MNVDCKECDGKGRWFDGSHGCSRHCNDCKGTGKIKVRVSSYKKTGYPRGRPRAGEIRPISLHAERMRKYRERRLIGDPGWYEVLAAQTRKWRANNPERANEIARDTYTRRKRLKETEGEVYVAIIGDYVLY